MYSVFFFFYLRINKYVCTYVITGVFVFKTTKTKNPKFTAKFDLKLEICPEMHALAKMAEMALNRQNRQTINKNSNKMAKGPFAKWRFGEKGRNGA